MIPWMKKRFSRVFSAQPYQLAGRIVSVETDITNGLHAFAIVGLPSKSVEESRDRVASAIKNSGFRSPKQENQKTVVSLGPAELRKKGPFFDLAIAVGYLLSRQDISFDPSQRLFVGELSLNGELQPVEGVLPIVECAKKNGFREVFLPLQNAEEASLVTGISIYGTTTLRSVIEHLGGTSRDTNRTRTGTATIPWTEESPFSPTFAVRNRQNARFRLPRRAGIISP